MIHRLRERPVLALIGALVLALGAFWMPRLPSLERPRLVVVAESPGRSRDELLDEVTRPLERGLASIPGAAAVESETGDGSVRVTVESEWLADTDRLRLDAERLLETLESPSVALSLETLEEREAAVEVAALGGGSRAARTVFARDVLLPELARIEGAGRAEIVGAAPLHAAVHPRAAALAARGLTAADLAVRLREVGAPHPAGRARAGDAARSLVVREEVSSLDGLRALRIPGPRGESVLGDVARVAVETLEDGSFCRVEGQDAVLVRVFRAPGAAAPALAREARSRVAELAGRSSGFALRAFGGQGGETLRVRYRLPADLAPEAARRLGLEVEKRAAMAVGRAQILGIQWPVDEGPAVDRDESGRLVLTFASSADARQARGRLAASLAGMPDVEAWVEPRGDAFPEVAGIIASAATPERAEALAGRVTARLRRSGLVPLRDSRHHPRPALLLSWDTPRLAALGLDRDRLEEQVRSGLEDEQAGRIHIEGVEPEILLRAVEPRDPALLPVALSPDAGVVPLTALARLAPGTRPGLLERWNGRPAVRLEFRGGDVDAGAALADLSLAPDEQVSPVGLRVLRWGKP